MFVQVSAGSEYGCREALYEVVEGVMVLRHEGDHDNLAGNTVVLDFEGFTLGQAQEKAKAINDTPVGHDWDGCHACKFSVNVRIIEPPSWFVYQEPPEAKVIQQALAQFRREAA
jgi:NAD-dependent dihydropyrimidine dehydrogenase PreA subunit